MGNCQAIDSASLVIQQPNGKAERLYWPVSAGEVMKMNPGHCVALLISTTLCPSQDNEKCHDKNNDNPINNPVRITRIKLLKPTDTLVLGQVYRLITTQEVMKGLLAKKQAKMKKNTMDSAQKLDWVKGKAGLETDKAARRYETEDKQVNLHHEIVDFSQGFLKSSRIRILWMMLDVIPLLISFNFSSWNIICINSKLKYWIDSKG